MTALGWVFLPAAALVALRWRSALPALLVVSTALQAGSLADVPRPAAEVTYGIPPYWFVASLLCAMAAWDWLMRRRPVFDTPAQRRAALLLWIYFAFAAVGAFLLPHLFEGAAVYTLLSHMGFAGNTTPLRFNLSHAVQAANVVLLGGILLYVLQRRCRDALLAGLAAAVLLVLAVGAWERLALFGWLPSFAEFWMSNRGYAQGHGAEVAGVLRISAPFSEPSYGSVFLAAVAVGCLAVAAFGRRWRDALIATAVVGAGLLNTLGSTGIAAGAIGAAVVLLLLARQAWSAAPRTEPRRRARLAWSLLGAALLAVILLGTVSPWAPRIGEIVQRGVVEKLGGETSLSTIERRRSNELAFGLVVRTVGLGTGLGSNRASSYLASLASNVGVIGCVLYLAAMWTLFTAGLRGPPDDARLFVLAAGTTATFGMWIGVPDLNLPFYWVFVFLMVAFAAPSNAASTCRTAAPVE